MKKNKLLVAMIIILVLTIMGNVMEVIHGMNNNVAINWAPFTVTYAALTVAFESIEKKSKAK